MNNKAFGYLFLVLGVVSVPLGYILVPYARYLASIPLADGSRGITNPTAGLWPVPIMVITAIAFFFLSYYFLKKARKSKDDSPKEI